MITMVNLEKRYGQLVAVKKLNLHIEQGEFFGFLGPNGAGKTTTIKILVGLLKPSAGSAIIAGYDIQRAPQEAKRQIGFIPDRPFLYEKLSGREFLRFVADLYGLEERQARTRREEFLELFELAARGVPLNDAADGAACQSSGGAIAPARLAIRAAPPRRPGSLARRWTRRPGSSIQVGMVFHLAPHEK